MVREIFQNPGIATGLKDNLAFLCLSGEPITVQDVANLKKAIGEKTELVNMYGATESTMIRTFSRIKEIPVHTSAPSLPAGKPISNTAVAIINDGMLCNIGEIGEIYFVTPFLSKGYYKDAEKTKKVFVQNPLVHDREDIVYKTGDYGYYLDDRSIQVLGRIDDQVKVNGIRVELGEVKQAVLDMPGIAEAEITVHKDEFLQSALVCYFVGEGIEADAVKEHLLKELNRNIVPSYFIKMDEFPRNINGKTDKKALPKPEDFLINKFGYEAPVNETETILESMCKEILEFPRVSRTISFFRIGGTSLKAMQYISRIYKQFGITLNLRDIFEKDTIAQLAGFLDTALAGDTYREIPTAAPSDNYELSHAQKRLWLIDQLQEGQVKYNMSFVSLIKGSLDIPALEKSVDTLIERHESFRTTFTVKEGEPRQRVHPVGATSFRINHIDISNYENKKDLADEIIQEEFTCSFDLQQGPLMRITLIRLSDQQFLFLLSMHHIISDGWSLEVFVRELFAVYNALTNGEANPLQPLRIQYKDFAAWQNSRLQGESLQQLETYWLGQFSEHPVPVLLPADFDGNAPVFMHGDFVEFEIDKNVADQLIKTAEKNTVSTFMVLLSVVNILLNRLTGQQDIIVGTPAATRNHPDLENQVGLFINVLPLRTKITPEKENFRDVLAKVKQTLLDALQHELYPYDLLVEKLGLADNTSRFPLINVLVQSQQILDDTPPALKNITVSDYTARSLTSKVDMTFNFKQTPAGIKVGIEYDASLFKRATVNSIVQNLQHIAACITAEDTLPVSRISLLASKEEMTEEENFKKMMLQLK
jgi:hypothetical protein